MQPKTLLDGRGNPVRLGYAAARPSWRKNEDALDRTPITSTEEKVLNHGSRIQLLSTLRDLERNNPVAKAICQVFVSNLGHCKYRSKGKDSEQKNELFHRCFRNAEIAGFGMRKILASIITDLLLAGEVFVLLTKGGKIQLLPSERVGSSYDTSTHREGENDGIVLNRFGQPASYRIAKITAGAVDYTKGSYVPAKDIIHISNTSRIGQIRGTPMLAAATQTLEDIQSVQAAYTAKVKTSSALTGFITSNQPYSARWDGNDFEDEPMRSTYTKLYNGSILLLEQGESVETIQGGSIDGVENFITQLISFACSSVGITHENLVGWSNASFSSSTATRAVTNHRFGQLRELIEDIFLQRFIRWRSFKYEASGDLPETDEKDREDYDLQWTTSPTLDRRKDAQTDGIQLDNNLASHTRIFAENGLDFASEAKQMIEDKKLIADLTNEAGIAEISTD